MSSNSPIFLIPILCHSHLFICIRAFIPTTKRNISKYLPWLFYRDLNKINIAPISKIEIINWIYRIFSAYHFL